MPIAIQTLYAEAKCFACYGISEAEALTLALERRWALAVNPAADVTPAGLLGSAACYACYTNGNLYDLFELALLNIVAEAS